MQQKIQHENLRDRSIPLSVSASIHISQQTFTIQFPEAIHLPPLKSALAAFFRLATAISQDNQKK